MSALAKKGKQKESIKNETPFQIVSLELIEMSLKDGYKKIGKEKSNTDLNQNHFAFQISMLHQANIQKNIFSVEVIINVTNNDSSVTYASIRTKSVFVFKDLSIYTDQNGILQIPDKYRDRTASIAISSTRGIMFTEFKATLIKSAVLPIIDVSVFEYGMMEPNQEQLP